MSIEQDHDAATAASLTAELARFGGDCWYDPQRRKVVYRTAEAAMRAYMILQAEQMDRHKWLESEKAAHDLQDGSLADWVARHSLAFGAYWRRTHVYVPADPPHAPEK